MVARAESGPIQWDYVDSEPIRNRNTGSKEVRRVTYARGDRSAEKIRQSLYVKVEQGTNRGITVYEPGQPYSQDAAVAAWPVYVAEASCAALVSANPPRYQFVSIETSFLRDETNPPSLEVYAEMAQIAGRAAINAARVVEEFHNNK